MDLQQVSALLYSKSSVFVGDNASPILKLLELDNDGIVKYHLLSDIGEPVKWFTLTDTLDNILQSYRVYS